MRTSIIPLAIFLAWLIPTLPTPTLSAEEITEAKFQQLHKQLQRPPEEPYLTIPWKISLLDAQTVAAQQQKPLFIWAMDGHPLGCT